MLKKLNILQLSTVKTWAGGEVHVYELTRKLKEKGHKVIAVCMRNSVLGQKLSKEGINTIYASPGLVGVFKLSRLIKQEKIQIIHAHAGRDYWTAVLAAKLAGQAKIVITRHIILPMRNNFIRKYFNNLVDKFIAVSQAVAVSLIKHNGIDEKRIAVIHNGIDLNKAKLNFSQKKLKKLYDIPADYNLVGCVGRLDEEKGQRDLIQAIPIILESCPNTKFLLVGEDSKGGIERSNLENLVKNLNLDNHVIFTGFVSNIPQVMAELDIFTLPSRQEPFGLVVLEAMDQGVPVVATKAGGIVEIVKDEVTGVLVEPKNPKELAKSVIYFLQNKDIARRLGEAGRKDVKERFSLDIMVEKVENTYYELLCN